MILGSYRDYITVHDFTQDQLLAMIHTNSIPAVDGCIPVDKAECCKHGAPSIFLQAEGEDTEDEQKSPDETEIMFI